MARGERATDQWVRSVAMAILIGFIVDGFLKAASKPAKRGPGRVVPSVVPAGLPPFPGGWEPLLPAVAAVSRRAAELLFTLWRQGEGATLTEETAGQWVTYQAQIHQEGSVRKKGVGTWRVKAGLHGAVG